MKLRNVSAVFVALYVILFARVYPAFGKLPSDPGYDFVAEMKLRGLEAFIAASEKYIQVAPRLVASVALLFPIEFQAIVLQLIQLGVLAGIGTLIAWALKEQYESSNLAAIAAFLFVTIPSASESTIGNAGSLKWPLLVLVAILGIANRFTDQHVRLSSVVFLLVTLSSPMAAVAFVSYLWRFGSQRALRRHRLPLVIAMLFGLMCQVIAWFVRNRGVRIYGDAGQMWPWPGMGVFWYLVWLGPLVLGVCVGVSALAARSHLPSKNRELLCGGCWLSAEAVVLSGLVWVSAGIKDSAAVATQSMAWIGAALVAFSLLVNANTRLMFRILSVLALVAMSTLAAKWFQASEYLTGGATWKESIARARKVCASQTTDHVQVELHLATVEMSCLELD